MNKRKPYLFDNEFALENENDIYGQHTEPHPFRLQSKSKKPKQNKNSSIKKNNFDKSQDDEI